MKEFFLPKIGLGTWGIGGKREADTSQDEQAVQAIQDALDIGYKHIDTAEMYGAGHCEELIGKAIKNYNRKDLILATKIYKTNLGHDDVFRSFEKSLKSLETDYIDILYLHAPNNEIPLSETMKAFNKLINEKMVNYIAVSNFKVEKLKEAQAHSNYKIVANQIEYNLLTRETGRYSGNTNMESEMLPYCQENNIYLVAERPLERGMLLERNEIMEEISQKYNKLYAQIALNWLVSQKNVVTIPKSTKIERLKENFEAGQWEMKKEDIEKLRKEYPNQV